MPETVAEFPASFRHVDNVAPQLHLAYPEPVKTMKWVDSLLWVGLAI